MSRLRLKLDMWILPLLTIIMLLSAMDKSDIGNAQTAGMQKAIKATDHQWAQVVSLFYIGYCLSQFLATLQMRRVGPPITVGGGTMFWGAMTMLMMVVKNWSSAVAVRVFIGFGEGYVHVASLYLSLWYGPEELATRGAIYFSTATIAGAFNGLISYGIVKDIGNTPPYAAWQWLFLIEGSITVAFGVLVVFLMPPVPERVKWGFSAEEKRLLVIRTWRANNTPNAKFKWDDMMVTFKDLSFYGYLLMFGACQIGISSLGSFLPAIIHEMGFTAVRSQLMTVPIYAAGFVGTVGAGFLADKFQRRGLAVIIMECVALIGYIILTAVPERIAPRYAALCLVAAGMFSNANLILTWLAFNTRKWSHRATAGAFVTTWGQAAALCGLQGFDTKPPYRKGNIVTLVCVAVGILGAVFNVWYYREQNKKKDAERDHPDTEIQRQKTFEELGTAHPDFRFSV
ncbi:major facilitator superfamily domain-containing protein [Xylogone sp. PMI_703]|nr:major facilitator superfamily domain-containing protein [Xylogone sp. PMI_703]